MTRSTRISDNIRLMNSLNFGDSDLEMNRRGQLSETQRTRLQRRQQGSNQMAWGCGALCAIPAGILLAALSSEQVARFVNPVLIGLVLGIGVLVVISAAVTQNGASEDLAQNRVESTTGLAKRHTERDKSRKHYFVAINDKSYEVPEMAYNTFKDAVYYRVYYTAYAHTLMSIEEVDTNP